MKFIDINPRYGAFLHRHGLDSPDRILAHPAVTVSGHPDRNVNRLTLGRDSDALAVFLKREHRFSWKDRLANAWMGSGYISRSYREYLLLQELRQAGIPCPEAVAAGEDDRGQAFLLIKEVQDARDLRAYLEDLPPGVERRAFARRLGQELAQIHAAGFDHPDLYTKHVLVRPDDGSVFFLDWQRSRRWNHLSWRRRARDLALLDATLADHLASEGDRLRCLRAYFQSWVDTEVGKNTARISIPSFSHFAKRIYLRRRRLQRHRRIRELRQPPLATSYQDLIRIDGESLCVAQTFFATFKCQIPDFLVTPSHAPWSHVELEVNGWSAHFAQRRESGFLRWLWSRLRGRPFTSPEVRQATTLFRLQRFGLQTPQMLAYGQKFPRPWLSESFLLTEKIGGSVDLFTWLRERPAGLFSVRENHKRRQVLRDAGAALRLLHQADCFLYEEASDVGSLFHILPGPRVIIQDLALVGRKRRLGTRQVKGDLQWMIRGLTGAGCTGADFGRFLRGYWKENEAGLRGRAFPSGAWERGVTQEDLVAHE